MARVLRSIKLTDTIGCLEHLWLSIPPCARCHTDENSLFGGTASHDCARDQVRRDSTGVGAERNRCAPGVGRRTDRRPRHARAPGGACPRPSVAARLARRGGGSEGGLVPTSPRSRIERERGIEARPGRHVPLDPEASEHGRGTLRQTFAAIEGLEDLIRSREPRVCSTYRSDRRARSSAAPGTEVQAAFRDMIADRPELRMALSIKGFRHSKEEIAEWQHRDVPSDRPPVTSTGLPANWASRHGLGVRERSVLMTAEPGGEHHHRQHHGPAPPEHPPRCAKETRPSLDGSPPRDS